MRIGFNEKLNELNNNLIYMGGLVEQSIADAILALRTNDVDLAKKVIANDSVINDFEKKIESESLAIILREQPVARDLRKVSAALKMVTDMERIGDNASDIADISLSANNSGLFQIVGEIQTMSDKVIKMVSDAVSAFVKVDLNFAKEVCDRDDEIDDLFDFIKFKIVDLLKNDEVDCDLAVDLMMITKYLERIADHAVNMCEWVEFFETGEYKNMQII